MTSVHTAYHYIRFVIQERTGLVLAPEKDYLLRDRLLPIAKERGFTDIDTFILSLQQNPLPKLLDKVADALMTHETFFFRDMRPFEEFRKLLWPYYMNARRDTRKLRVWSAACSTGQEPYSLAMQWLEIPEMQRDDWQFNVCATDICASVIEQAKEALYTQFEVQRGLPVHHLPKYFMRCENLWKVLPHVRNLVEFRQHNLLMAPPAEWEKFDVIFCRNILIYFDDRMKRQTFQRIAGHLAQDGVLVMGSAENPSRWDTDWKSLPDSRYCYTRQNSAWFG